MSAYRGPERRKLGLVGATSVQGAQGPPGPPAKISKEIKRAFIIITAVFFLVAAGFSWLVHDLRTISDRTIVLVGENERHIRDIQETRITACVQTYTGIHEVFEEFFPEPPRSLKEQSEVDKFNATITRLTKECTMND